MNKISFNITKLVNIGIQNSLEEAIKFINEDNYFDGSFNGPNLGITHLKKPLQVVYDKNKKNYFYKIDKSYKIFKTKALLYDNLKTDMMNLGFKSFESQNITFEEITDENINDLFDSSQSMINSIINIHTFQQLEYFLGTSLPYKDITYDKKNLNHFECSNLNDDLKFRFIPQEHFLKLMIFGKYKNKFLFNLFSEGPAEFILTNNLYDIINKLYSLGIITVEHKRTSNLDTKYYIIVDKIQSFSIKDISMSDNDFINYISSLKQKAEPISKSLEEKEKQEHQIKLSEEIDDKLSEVQWKTTRTIDKKEKFIYNKIRSIKNEIEKIQELRKTKEKDLIFDKIGKNIYDILNNLKLYIKKEPELFYEKELETIVSNFYKKLKVYDIELIRYVVYIFMNDLGLLKNQEKLGHKNQLIGFKEYLSIYGNDIYEKIMNSLKSLDITNIVYLTKIERFKFLRNRSERGDLINPGVTSYLSEYIIDNIKEIKNTVRVGKEYKIKINSKNEVRFEDFYLLLGKSKNKVFSYDLNDIHSYFISAEYSGRENFKLLRLRVLYDLFVDYSNVNIPKVKLALDRISPTEFIIKKR